MSAIQSEMLDLGTKMPDFKLPDVTTRGEFDTQEHSVDQGVVVAFICNHCPYVKHIREQLVQVAQEYQEKGFQFLAINSNDTEAYPDDAPDKMKAVAKKYDFPFPYLYDASQEVAKAYHATCTPDLFVFDGDRNLVYRGQFDGSRPGNDIPVTGEDLKKALDAVLENHEVPADQTPSIGCSIKWKSGNAPQYAS